MNKLFSKALLLAVSMLTMAYFTSCSETKNLVPEKCVFAFYYNWYGNTEHNGKEVHWEHGVIKNSDYKGNTDDIKGQDNLATNFYPELKNYSSTDPVTIARHIKMMAQAKIDVVVVTWWGVNDFGSPALPALFDEAAKHNMKVCFHIEPYAGRGAESLRANIADLTKQFGSHPAFYRMEGKPSYLTPASEWARVCLPEGDLTIRGTELDSKIIGLWVKDKEQDYFLESGLDGFYTYFAATGFTYGSTPANWKGLQEWASQNGKVFIPCVGPGYIDTRVRPWNTATTRDRENGKYYTDMFQAAVESGTSYIGITSFNEWHEGTQIEPAVPFKSDAFQYLDYSPLAPDYYLTHTAELVSAWK
mgnify:FL=1